MTDQHVPRSIERHCDVAVIGGGAAGLAAALQLARQRRSVIVVDAGEPRNAPAAHVHGYLGHEGRAPAELAAIAREEVRSYGGEVVAGRALVVARTVNDRFRIDLVGGHAIVARRVLAATGLVDELPDIVGIAAQWGSGVIHCPFCHGYEVRDRRVVHVVTHPMGLHPAVLYRHLTDRYSVVLHGDVDAQHPAVDALRSAGVPVVDARVERVVTDDDGQIIAVELADGARIDADAVVVGTRFAVRAEPFTAIGVLPVEHPTGLGDHLVVDAAGATAVAGVYAAGNVTDPSHQVLQAAAHGSWVGAMISFDLANDDQRAGSRSSANATDWDHRYSGEPLWSGNPNGALVREINGVEPGRALDVGAGEGGDAIWLAEQGWTVTANDISQRALDRLAAEAERRGLHIECNRADANMLDPFGSGIYDLVSAHYASIPRTADGRGARNLLNAVAPGGTLLMVAHDLAPMRTPIDTHLHSRPFDPDAYLRVDDVAAALAETPDWDIEINETRPRPPGAVSGHHVDDVVLCARRRDR